MRKLMGALTVIAALPFTVATAVAPVKAKVPPPPLKFSKAWYGTASWYGQEWAGRKTACGKIFDPEALTVAHPTLACGTWVRLTYRGKQTFAKVTDRGPYLEGREMDVSHRVAERLGLVHVGLGQVKIEVVRDANGKSHPPMEYYQGLN